MDNCWIAEQKSMTKSDKNQFLDTRLLRHGDCNIMSPEHIKSKIVFKTNTPQFTAKIYIVEVGLTSGCVQGHHVHKNYHVHKCQVKYMKYYASICK